MMRIALGYPDQDSELAMLKAEKISEKKLVLDALIDLDTLFSMQKAVRAVKAGDNVLHYLLRLINESRYSGTYANPLSPRCSKILLQAAKAMAFINQRDYVIPEDIQAVFVAVTDHRLAGVSARHGDNVLSRTLLDSVDPLA